MTSIESPNVFPLIQRSCAVSRADADQHSPKAHNARMKAPKAASTAYQKTLRLKSPADEKTCGALFGRYDVS
jgi:hypothetical protein